MLLKTIPRVSALRNMAVFCAMFGLMACAASQNVNEQLSGSMNEQVLMVPGDPERPVMLQVTLLKPDGSGPFPLAVLNHDAYGGQSPDEQPRYRGGYLASYFLSRGYAVALPMMRGYAGSEGRIGLEKCNFRALALKDAQDIDAVLSYFQKQPYVDPARVVVGGQGFGGWNTLGFGTLKHEGVHGLMNFSAGVLAGRCPAIRELPNSAGILGLYTKYPSIWFYGENDKLFVTDIWRSMYENYTNSGAKVELVDIGNFMDDSHQMLRYPESMKLWAPKLDAFLASVNMPAALINPGYLPTRRDQ